MNIKVLHLNDILGRLSIDRPLTFVGKFLSFRGMVRWNADGPKPCTHFTNCVHYTRADIITYEIQKIIGIFG